MQEVTRWQSSHLVETQLKQELARQLGNVQLATELTRISLREIRDVHQTASTVVAATLREAQQMINEAYRAGRMSPEKERELHLLTKAYIDRMLVITNSGSTQMTQILLTCSTRR